MERSKLTRPWIYLALDLPGPKRGGVAERKGSKLTRPWIFLALKGGASKLTRPWIYLALKRGRWQKAGGSQLTLPWTYPALDLPGPGFTRP